MQGKGRRKAPRKAVEMGAVVSDRAQFISLPCSIRDGSAAGCRIAADDLELLPDEICLQPEAVVRLGPCKQQRIPLARIVFERSVNMRGSPVEYGAFIHRDGFASHIALDFCRGCEL